MEHSQRDQTIIYLLRLGTIMLITSLICIWLNHIGFGKENILMVFMVGILVTSACTRGYAYGIAVAVIGVMIFNYFFTTPTYTFAITNTNDIVRIFFFLITAVIASGLTVRFRKQLSIAQRNEQTARLLHEMSSSFINITGKENIVRLGIRYIERHTGFESLVELLDGEVIGPRGSESAYPAGECMMVPITGLAKDIGLLKVYNHNLGLTMEEDLLIRTMANQIGIALDREMIYNEQEKIRVEMEREHMRSSMLRSLSHDFRTPLTGIIGDSSLIMNSEDLDAESIRQLAVDINEQAEWLVKMMENILNLTKLESGKLNLCRKTEVVEDIIYEAASHVIGLREHRRFGVSLPDEVIAAQMDGPMMVQVITNLLDNAVKHTQENGRITVSVSRKEEKVYIMVEDDGEGIDPKILDTLFEEFITAPVASEDQKRGIGLGLAISKGVVEAHGGEIRAENREEGGARFTFWLRAERMD